MRLALTATAFDKAYIDNEVAYHKAVIDALKRLLIPQPGNERKNNCRRRRV